MRPDPDRVLVITDAGLPALVACMLWAEPAGVTLWLPPEGSPSIDSPAIPIGDRHRKAAQAQADLLGLADFEAGGALPGPVSLSMMLLFACEHAARAGIGTVVWPVVCAESIDALAVASDRARLLSRLAMLDSQGRAAGGVRTPLADLTETEVAELAVDLDAPFETLWWRRSPDADEPTQAEAELRLKWEGAVREASRAVGFVGVPGETPAARA